MSTDDQARYGAFIAWCFLHERQRPGLRVVRRCCQRVIRTALAGRAR